MHKVDIAYKCENILGEGITFSRTDQTLFWLDINNTSNQVSMKNLNVSVIQKFLSHFILYLSPALGKKILSMLKKSIAKAVPFQLFKESTSPTSTLS